MASSVKNVLGIPPDSYGTHGIAAGNEIARIARDFAARSCVAVTTQYLPDSRKIVVLGSSNLNAQHLEFYFQARMNLFIVWKPSVCQNRDSNGNLLIELTSKDVRSPGKLDFA